MKISKFNENKLYTTEQELKSYILAIIENEVETEHVPYSDNDDYEISSKSREKAADEIVKYIMNDLTSEIIKEIQLKMPFFNCCTISLTYCIITNITFIPPIYTSISC